MTNLRQAAEMALKRLDMYFVDHGNDDDFAALQALRQALAQPEQEPVCFLRETSWSYEIAPWDDPNGIPVYTAPVDGVNISQERVDETAKGEHEPVAWLSIDSIGERYLCFSKPTDNDKIQPLYTAPPKREWVGLSDEEIMDRWPCETRIEFARWVESKLKEKNGG